MGIPALFDIYGVLPSSLMVKGVGDVSEPSTSVCRRRYEQSQRKKSVIAPTNAILPTTIPAMAPTVRDFDECDKVEVEVALVSVDSVRDVIFDWDSDVGRERKSDTDWESEIDIDWKSDLDSGSGVDVDWESIVGGEIELDGDWETGVDANADIDGGGCELLVKMTAVDAQWVKELFPLAALVSSMRSRDYV